MNIFKITFLGIILTLLSINVWTAEIAIYSPETDGGSTNGKLAITNTLKEAGIKVDDLNRLSLANLLKYKVIIIPNTKKLSRSEDPGWRENLRAYVTQCGGALMFCHDSVGARRSTFGKAQLFPEVVTLKSVEHNIDRESRSPANVKIKIVSTKTNSGFDFLPGHKKGQTNEHMFYDHFAFTPLKGETILVDDKTGKAVVAVAEIGPGRVVLNGMIGFNPAGAATCMKGIDRDVMIGTVKWCLAGKGLVVTDPAKVKLEKWQGPESNVKKGKHKVAVVGSMNYDTAHRAKLKIDEAGISFDYLPIEFLEMRDLTGEGYKMVIFFAPFPWEEAKKQDAIYDKVFKFIDSGGKAIIYLPGMFNKTIKERLLKTIGSKEEKCYRKYPLLRKVEYQDANNKISQFSGVPTRNFTYITKPELKDVETTGWWIDNKGERVTSAIIKTKYGYLLNFNPVDHDNRLFIANAAVSLLPEIGKDVYKNLLKIYEDNKSQVEKSKLSSAGKVFLKQAEKSCQSAKAAVVKKDYTNAISMIQQADDQVTKAYAVSMTSPKDEVRMVCVHVKYVDDPEIVCERLANAGLKGIALMGMEGLYPSELFDWNDDLKIDKADWMKKWIEAAHKRGLKAGPVFATFSVYKGTELYDKALSENWRTVQLGLYGKKPKPLRKKFRIYEEVCHSYEGMEEYAVKKSQEVMKKYPVDFVVYDYIRWKSTCYCDACRKLFEKRSGLKIEKWPDDVCGKYQKEYNDFRSSSVTTVIRETAKNIAKINPKIKLGVFTRGGKRVCWGQGQYWWEWGDYVNYFMPMCYGPDNQAFETLCKEYNSEVPPEKNKAKLVPALAPTGSKGGSYLSRLEQISLCRKYAPTGMAFFWYHGMSDAYLNMLKFGPFRNGTKK